VRDEAKEGGRYEPKEGGREELECCKKKKGRKKKEHFSNFL
jgi:hypothetical protein